MINRDNICHMKNLLLLMPYFMGYETAIYEVLCRKYNTWLFNSDLHDREFVKAYYDVSFIRRGFRYLNKRIKSNDREAIFQSTLTEDNIAVLTQQNYDYILCINGCYLPDSLYNLLRENNPNSKFIYYAWDDIRNLWKDTHLSFFDELYSYNIDDCKEYGMNYLPMFVRKTDYDAQEEKKYDISFIATARSGRYRIARRLIRKYGKKYKLFIYLYSKDIGGKKEHCYSSPLTYNKYMDVLANSKCLLEIPMKAQKGPTARCFDALITQTKVITTNKEIKKYPVWSPNIMMIDRNKLDIDESFVCSPYIESEYKPLDVGEWLKKLGL